MCSSADLSAINASSVCALHSAISNAVHIFPFCAPLGFDHVDKHFSVADYGQHVWQWQCAKVFSIDYTDILKSRS